MSLQQQQASSAAGSTVADFYDGRSVLITGAAGYLGSVLLEVLLRCCPGIRRIYILLREKKGVQPQDRKEIIFRKEIFCKLKSESPDVLDKVTVVSGDVTHADLGMRSEDLQEVTDHVTVVFHCAAVISFLKTFQHLLSQNALGTENVMKLGRKLRKLDALIFVSTAFSNCNRSGDIEEKVYDLPVSAGRLLKAIDSPEQGDDCFEDLLSQCSPSWPNGYTFSKCVAERLLAEDGRNMPIAIVRPSIIVSIWKDPLPGYVEEGAGVIDVSIGIGKGFVRVLQYDPDKSMDIVPVDGVANTLIVAAWSVATKRSESPLVVNCTRSDNLTWGHFVTTLMQLNWAWPLPNSFQTPGLTSCSSNAAFRFHCAFEHYVPGVVIDALLLITGRKPRLVKLYRFYDKCMHQLRYFTLNDWIFRNDNFRDLATQLSEQDAVAFPIDLTEFGIDAVWKLPTGAPFYRWDTDSKKFAHRMELVNRRYLIIAAIKWTATALIFYLLYLLILRC